MADERLGGMLIFSITFLGAFIALITLIPSDFFIATKEYQDYDVPDFFTPEDIQHIKYYTDVNITWSGYEWFDFNPDINVKIVCTWGGWGTTNLYFEHVVWEFWFLYTVEKMYYQDAWGISETQAVAAWNPEINASVIYPLRCDHLTTKLWITDTNAERMNISDAWDDGELYLGIGFGYEDVQTKLNAWDIVGRLLTFQSPEIFGATGATAIALNLIISLPFWCCVGYLIYRLILMAIPFVSG